jgi:hypothetical protein
MKKYYQQSFLFLIIGILSACSTGQTSYKKGDYYDATLKAVNNLRSNPSSKRSLATIQQSYPMALSYKRQKIDEYTYSNNPNKYLKIEETYAQLNNLADEISRCPAALELLKPVVYFNEQHKIAEELAIKEQYAIAIDLLEIGQLKEARLAYNHLEWVKKRQPLYADIDRQLAIALDLATLKVVVESLPEGVENYDIDSNPFYYLLFDQLDNNNNYKFIRYYRPELAQELEIIPQQIVQIQFKEFIIKTLVNHESENTYQSDSIVVGSFTDKSGTSYDVSGTVKATTIVYEQELTAKIVLSISIIDYVTKEVLKNQIFPGEYLWENSWATYNGDERAVPNTITPLLENKQLLPPSPQEMFILSSKPLLTNASSYIKSYYRKK